MNFDFDNRPLPHDLNVERAVLGSLLKEPELIDDAVAMLKKPEVFYSHVHRTIYQTVTALHGRRVGIDAISVGSELAAAEKLEQIGGELFLFELTENLPTTANFESHAATLVNLSSKRDLITAAAAAITSGYDGGRSADDLIDEFAASLEMVRDGAVLQSGETISEQLCRFMENLKTINGAAVSYGFDNLDSRISHFPGQFHVIAAGSGTGKTTLALSAMPRQAQIKRRTALYCVETDSDELAAKMACIVAQVSYSKLVKGDLHGDEFRRYQMAVAELAELSDYIFIRGTGDFVRTPAGINADLRAIERDHGKVDMVYVDYLQNLDCPRGVKADDRNSRNDINAEELDRIFKKLHVAGTVFAQLNREGQKNPKARPRIYHVKYCGVLENVAHIISFMWDKEADTRDMSLLPTTPIDIKMYSDKNRNGANYSIIMRRMPQGPYFIEGQVQPRYTEKDHPEPPGSDKLPYKDRELL